MSMDENHGPHAPAPPEEQIKPDTTPIQKEDVLTQFAVIETKDGRVAVQFPLLDPVTQTVDLPLALELAGAGLQTLARVVRMQTAQALAMMKGDLPPQEKEKGRIAVVPAMPKEFLTKPQ